MRNRLFKGPVQKAWKGISLHMIIQGSCIRYEIDSPLDNLLFFWFYLSYYEAITKRGERGIKNLYPLECNTKGLLLLLLRKTGVESYHEWMTTKGMRT